MKHFLLFVFLFVIAVNGFSQISQGGWRFRNDDGSEITATWLAEQNATAVIRADSTGLIRLRIELYNNGTLPANLLNGVLQDSGLFSAGQWITIPSSGVTLSPFTLAGTSPNVTDGEMTTPQLNKIGLTYQSGDVIVSSDMLASDEIVNGNETEYEWVLKPTTILLPGTTYYFRYSPAQSTDFVPIISLQTASTLSVKLSSFNALLQGKSVKLNWTTASEDNNDHFVVEKSKDTRSWSAVATITGNGTTAQQHTYTAYDNTPAVGMNYYRIKQVDGDGKTALSYIRSVNILGNTAVLVYPNPVRASAGINVNITGYTGKVAAVLTDMNGNIVHTENIQANAQTTGYRLNVGRQPASGIYFLHLKADGFDKVIKIAIQ